MAERATTAREPVRAILLIDNGSRRADANASLEEVAARALAQDPEDRYPTAAAMADALHAEGMQLALTLGTPAPIGNGWDTGGQNWAALGHTADIVHIQMPLDPTAYVANGPAERLVAWTVGQIDRSKVPIGPGANARMACIKDHYA